MTIKFYDGLFFKSLVTAETVSNGASYNYLYLTYNNYYCYYSILLCINNYYDCIYKFREILHVI
jgi:hypothetical protein